LHIKFAHLSYEQNNEESKHLLCSFIKGFDKILNDNPNINPYFEELLNLMKLFKSNCSDFEIRTINKDLSFDFNIKPINEKKKILFTKLISLKKENKNISQVDISMESLENILTKI